MSAQGIHQKGLTAEMPTTWPLGRVGDKEEKERDLDSSALMDRFLRGVERRAFLTARMATQDEDEALDIVQDAMLGLVQKYSHHSEQEWGALFHSILHSKINDWYRRRQVRSRWRVFFTAPREDEDDIPEPDEWVAQTQFLEPDRQMQTEMLGEQLVALIGQLPLRQQQALVLRAWEGYNITETAEIMRCSEGSVKTHFSRAVHSLREKLGDYYE